MDDTFFAALFQRRHRILGFRLRPYCYGHVAALYAIGSPFAAPAGSGAEAGAGDLVAALRVCGQPGFPLIDPDSLRPRLRDYLFCWWLEQVPARLARAVKAFLAYRDDHSSFPQLYEQETAGGEDMPADKPRLLSAPYLLSRVCSLVSRTTIRWDQAWQMPLALPSWIISTLDEQAGGNVRFVNEGDGDDLPPEENLTEEELYARAVAHLGEEAARTWYAARQATKAKLDQKGAS